MSLRAGFVLLASIFILSVSAPGAMGAPAAGGGGGPDWGSVPGVGIKLFYPGVTSWEFLGSDDHRLGGRGIKRGNKECRHCHLSRDGVLDLKAEEIVSGAIRMKRSHRPLEPVPGPIRKGVIDAQVQAVYDDSNLYVRVSWPSEGVAWEAGGEGTAPDRVSMQLNSAEPLFAKYGCFISCHDSVSSMPESPSAAEVSANPYYKSLGRDEVRLYAVYARDGWKSAKARSELDRIRSAGGLIDLLSVELSGGKAKARDGWILDDRRWESDSRGIEVTAGWSAGSYTVVFKRALSAGDAHDLAIKPGTVVNAGLSIHDLGSEKRKHYVSFPFSIGLGEKADVKAVRIK